MRARRIVAAAFSARLVALDIGALARASRAALAIAAIVTLLAEPASAQQRLSIQSWAYQLDGIEPDRIARSGFELIVIDYSADGSAEEAFTPGDVEAMKRMPDSGRRRVVAYMSIGEAEDYRFYWQDAWRTRPPTWLDEENPDWPGNYKVRFWEPSWQAEILGSPIRWCLSRHHRRVRVLRGHPPRGGARDGRLRPPDLGVRKAHGGQRLPRHPAER